MITKSPRFCLNYYRSFKEVLETRKGKITPWIGKQDGYGQFPSTFVEACGEDHDPAARQQIRGLPRIIIPPRTGKREGLFESATGSGEDPDPSGQP